MISALLYDLNCAALWQREVRVWDRTVLAASLDRLLFLGLHRLGWMGEDEDRLLRRLKNLIPFRCAAGSLNGRTAFARSTFNSGNNALAERKAGTFEVNLVRVDDVLPVTTVDFIKIDVQGHELAALTGLKRTLTSNPGTRVMFEFWPVGLRSAKTEPEELLRFLSDFGFVIHATEDAELPELTDIQSLIRKLGANGYTNLLASRTGVPAP
ncbi:MAG: FkbM family methyltransferase [Verrucomicrobiota bacterium]|nr:FkbM family methyltransferase [Verrucomicrobiota bacterium]